MKCPECKKNSKELYQRVLDGKFVCLSCVDQQTFRQYPEMKKLKSKNLAVQR